METQTTVWERLAAPFNPEIVHWRVGSTTQDKTSGLALAYVDARDVMNRLDSVLGPTGWGNRSHSDGAKTFCELSIKDPETGEWVTKSDGAGDTNFEGDKGAISDAFKRAAVRWGIGRYLYDVKSTWVKIEPSGKSFKIKESELSKLQDLLPRAETHPSHVASESVSEPVLGQKAPTHAQAQGEDETLLEEVERTLGEGDMEEVWKSKRQTWMVTAGTEEGRAALGKLYAELSNQEQTK